MNYFTVNRTPGTRKDGGSFLPTTVETVWRKGKTIPGYPASKYRKDSCGAIIQRSMYGKKTKNGWEIDHDKPVSKGGGDELSNLKPLQWENNRYKSDNWPYWSCKIRS